MPVDRAAMFGQEIAKEIKGKVDGVILTSTWGTDTRCGATIVKELDREGIPAVHIATITPISLSVGANRVVEGVSIPHPTGHVELTKEKEKQERAKQIHLALDALSENIQEQKVFEEGETLWQMKNSLFWRTIRFFIRRP